MSKDQSDFFKEPTEWAVIKNSLLSCYLVPYFQKILCTRKTINYIDCFAGAGKFDTGEDGSPLIALKIINNCISKSKFADTNINCIFIEPKVADVLIKNIGAFNRATVISSKYEDEIKRILEGKLGENVFLYIDPFGIKSLRYDLYEYYSKAKFNSIELLINFNSFGFIRDACRVMKCPSEQLNIIMQIFQDYSYKEDVSIQELDNIAGGNYWRKIIQNYIDKNINCYEAEVQLSDAYCKRLNEHFKYVINIPIRLKKGQKPKYRMIHATNNEDGCLLMYENMCKRWECLSQIQTNGQCSLFEETPENDMVDEVEIRQKIIELLKNVDNYIHFNEFIAKFVTKNGIICEYSRFQKIVREMEKNAQVLVKRNPALTPTGKTSTFLEEKRSENHFVEIKVSN